MDFFEGFERRSFDTAGARIVARVGGTGRPLVLLHGFPQTHAIWHRVARRLADRYQLVLPDLRGYGDSSKPTAAAAHADSSKRAMAGDIVEVMRQLGHARFGVVGHDRGGRVAHRLALDHAACVDKLVLLDIAPTLDMYERADERFGRAYYHWFHLIQPAPLPERMIGGDAPFYLRWTLGGWGAQGTGFIEPEALAEYERCFCTPEAIHAACEDYRASAGIDLEHDRASRAKGERIACELLVLWGARGVIAQLYEPLALWGAQCARRVRGGPLPCGHFVPEEQPEAVAAEIAAFFR